MRPRSGTGRRAGSARARRPRPAPHREDEHGGWRRVAPAARSRLRWVRARAGAPGSNVAPPPRHILPSVDHTAPAVLELGLLLLLAALAGSAVRRVGLPAVIGYLLVGVVVSPFTPGYVANRDQLSILADVGVVLLLFEVGIEINPLRLAREGRRLLLLAPLQVLVTWVLSAAACLAFGLKPAGAAIVGLSIAMSSSVVVVNVTRSRRRTTDARTDDVLLGWSVIQDLVGV